MKMVRDRLEVLQELRYLTDKMDTFIDTMLEAIDQVPDLVCIWRGDKIYFANRSFRTILGYSREELMDNPWTDYVYEEDLDKTLRAITDTMRHRKAIMNLHNRWVCKNGDLVEIVWTASVPSPKGYSIALGVMKSGY